MKLLYCHPELKAKDPETVSKLDPSASAAPSLGMTLKVLWTAYECEEV